MKITIEVSDSDGKAVALLKSIAEVVGIAKKKPAKAAEPESESESESEAPAGKKGKGKDAKAADSESESEAKSESSEVSSEDADAKGDELAEGYTLEQVKAPYKAISKKFGREEAFKVLKKATGSESFGGLDKKLYKKAMDAANKKLGK